ncbi:hypothetical protein K431DRAFT_298863 [Polychaeton citri CBS 116435]|uniref:Uncharacterized protein n=1 Tax=Polychaeton citri CBS 116435 TaxID=1314669 RepID=A0A9P4Q0L9_9PEZI|nr:hypothetical protein K431DRAFT_298863 [Polychaeton citri CBS 116435]
MPPGPPLAISRVGHAFSAGLHTTPPVSDGNAPVLCRAVLCCAVLRQMAVRQAFARPTTLLIHQIASWLLLPIFRYGDKETFDRHVAMARTSPQPSVVVVGCRGIASVYMPMASMHLTMHNLPHVERPNRILHRTCLHAYMRLGDAAAAT